MSEDFKNTFASGRRKSASATARFNKKASCGILINGRVADQYFLKKSEMHSLMKPVLATEFDIAKTSISITVGGGGTTAQSSASKLALARLFSKNGYFDTMKKYNFLRADCRKKERKKYGMKGPRAKRQFSKR